jgi:hypothetical protein
LSEYVAADVDELPPRPRRRLFTPVTGSLLAVLVAACGFVGGVLIEKGHAGGGTSGAAGAVGGRGAGGFGARAAGARGQAAAFPGGQAGAGGTAGQVSSVRGSTLYIQDTQGNTLRVTLPAGASVTRTTTSSVRAIHPGDAVVVQGSTRHDGSIRASSIRATAADVGGAAAISQLFGGGGTGSGARGAGN